MSISPLAPKEFQSLPPIPGVRLGAVEAGIKKKGRKDLCALVFDAPARAAGVFTRSKCPSAAVDWCRSQLPGGVARGVIVNSGNANAFTGRRGVESARITAEAAAAAIGCPTSEIFLASTGVIGEPLDANAFAGLLAGLCTEASSDRWREAAEAIRTTDTYPKLATASVELGERRVTINGIAKGSGMIAPDMATMLSFVVTDAPIAAPLLQTLLSESTRTSFNAITVDSDTSTSDTVLLFSVGEASTDALIQDAEDPRLAAFRSALAALLEDLALQIVRDGEGATKLVEVVVSGAVSRESAHRIAMSIANSPLVKTAVAGEDANWGRVVMAVGKAGEPADRDRLAIWFGDLRVAVDGERDPDYSEAQASRIMKNEEIRIRADVGVGDAEARVFTCDLTKQYISINADYRT